VTNRIGSQSFLSEAGYARSGGDHGHEPVCAKPSKIRMVAALLVALTGAVASSAFAGYMVTMSYVGGPGDLVSSCRGGRPLVTNVGGVCFNVPSDSTTVAVTINDNSGMQAAGFLTFVDDGGNALGSSVTVCGGNPSIPVPKGSTGMGVVLEEIGAPLNCPGASPATSGTVTATFN
jgi:hypothetical protein